MSKTPWISKNRCNCKSTQPPSKHKSTRWKSRKEMSSSICFPLRIFPVLIRSALIKRSQDSNVYISLRKSMTIWFFIHSRSKRAESIALIDSGATENFMSLEYAKYLHLPIRHLPVTRKLFNVDRTPNKSGELQYFTDLQVRTGSQHTRLRFFLTNLGENKAILGYPWFAAVQPRINWKRGWIDHAQLPLIFRSDDAAKAQFLP